MPIYEYECQQGHRFEQRQSFSDDPLKECVTCGQAVRRLLSPAGIIFKGSGWYITDSRPAPKNEDSSSSSTSTSTSSTSSTSSSSSKSDSGTKKAEAAA